MARYLAPGRNILLTVAFVGAFAWTTHATATADATSQGGAEAAADCPITQANDVAPPPHLEHYAGKGGTNSYYEDGMWVGVGPGIHYTSADTANFLQADGSMAIKFWWTRGDGVRGEVVITGRRLDGEAPPPRFDDQFEQYGSIGFTPMPIIFPTAGCWEITGTVGEHSLTFVVFLEEPFASATPVATPVP